jgi:integrase
MAKAKRQRNGQSTIYKGSDGYWHGRVTIGELDNGKPNRPHTMSKDRAKVVERVEELEKIRDEGLVYKPGENWTVAEWLTFWLESIATPFVGFETASGYRVAVTRHLIPAVGHHKLRKLRPEHLERLYLKMLETPTRAGTLTKPATAHQVHRTVRTSLNEAVRRGHLGKNPALVAKAPQIDDEEIEPYTVDEVKRLLETALSRRNGTRWAIALALGLRQGEVLGLKWEDVNIEFATLRVRRNRIRPKYRHGCDERTPCGRKYPGYCPARIAIRPATGKTKSRAGRRTVGLPAELCALLEAHRTQQDAEKAIASQLWVDGGWLFADETGHALNPRTDWDHWKQLLADAGVRDARLHDARHTAATVLLLLGVTDRAMTGIMGWSNAAMAGRYAHIVAPLRQDIAKRVGGLIWSEMVEQSRDDEESNDASDEDEPEAN